ncbi:MAG TPA: kelch repeat-containing protein, partial [Thermoplasmata archaeon]|nr:kelch repeat-containing protein [Thermoplasmata archaeon]
WARSNGSGAPDPRTFAAMAYDEAASVVVLFGGGGTPRRNDTWIFDPSTGKWQNVTTGLRPPGRSAHAMTFDARLGKVVLFGGCCRGSNPYSSLPFDDVWTFDATSREWSPLPMPGPVPGRAGHGMVYDRNAGVLVVFGNQLWLGSTGTRDTWTLDSLRHEWVSRSAPQGGYGHLAVDRLSGEVVAIGGPLANEAWSFDGGIGTWSFIGATNRSYGYYSASAVDTARSRIVIHRRSALADGQRSLGVRSPEQDVDEPDEPGRAPAELGRGARI